MCGAYCMSGVSDLLTELLQIARDGGLGRIRKIAAAQPVRTPLQARAEIVLIHAIDRAPQFRGGRWLRGSKLACRRAHLLSQPREFVSHLLAFVDDLVDLLRGRRRRLTARGAGAGLLLHQVAYVIRLLLLLVGQLFGRLRHGIQATGGILLLCAAEQIGGFAQAIGRAPGIGRTGVARCRGALHVFVGLAQTIKRLLGRLLTRVGCLFGGLLGITRTAAATSLSRLPGTGLT